MAFKSFSTSLDIVFFLSYKLPYADRVGAIAVCAAKVLDGSITQPDQSYLDDDQLDDGYLLTCVAYATTDCIILTHQEHKINGGK
ncbi:2Fe-2S iron-sulfur cluster-binding protein [Tenacibaculum aiptasiae]|uniref:2Fe-2S iron-sulfur cluster-binding protein n=1 Tax=Tenacibaculum aiptasiae TaxID=426481 RepID=UPI002938EFD0|nr:2Fe-2S iron-sulfur cluster-binding protein [Tenacibaculum aiptasiae]